MKRLIQKLKERRRKKRLRRLKSIPMTYGQYCLLYSVGATTNHDYIVEHSEKPKRLCGRYLPEDLSNLRMGKFIELMNCKDEIKLLTTVYNVTESELQSEWAQNVVGAIKWTIGQLESITGLFSQLEDDIATEKRGNVFSTIDWYALRMGITNHDEVLKVPCITIWRCALEDQEKRKEQLKKQKNDKRHYQHSNNGRI